MKPMFLKLSILTSYILLESVSLAIVQVDKEHISSSSEPEINMNATEILRRWGYKSEIYEAITEDGYILTVVRIPPTKRNGTLAAPVVFLQHGLESCCVDWIVNLPGQSAGFYFADAGFDVWLGNFRGSVYSRRHTTLNPNEEQFWQFTWDQMAQYDLPAMINKALEVTNASQLYYVGHSEGTLAAFAKFSHDEEISRKVRAFFALAPVFTLKNIEGPFRYIAKATRFPAVFKLLCGRGQFLPREEFISLLAKHFCPLYVAKELCSNVFFLIAGQDSHQLNTTRIGVYVAHDPAGTSVKNVIHFGQMVKTGRCRMFDYENPEENRKHYGGRDTPPEYDISGVKVPTVIFYSTNDYLSTAKDVRKSIIGKFKALEKVYMLENYNHLDFIWGLRATGEIYRPIEQYINWLHATVH